MLYIYINIYIYICICIYIYCIDIYIYIYISIYHVYMEQNGAAKFFRWFSENQTKGSAGKSHNQK